MGGGDLASAPDVAEKDVEAARDGAHLVRGVKAGSRLSGWWAARAPPPYRLIRSGLRALDARASLRLRALSAAS